MDQPNTGAFLHANFLDYAVRWSELYQSDLSRPVETPESGDHSAYLSCNVEYAKTFKRADEETTHAQLCMATFKTGYTPRKRGAAELEATYMLVIEVNAPLSEHADKPTLEHAIKNYLVRQFKDYVGFIWLQGNTDLPSLDVGALTITWPESSG